jgi:hypothetical protein
MDFKTWWRVFVKLIISILCAGISYAVWLAAFLLTLHWDSPIAEAIKWLSAPVVPATGFAIGVALSERLTRANKTGFLRIFVWPLIGCVLGAGAVYWFGPMLIVFGMFAAGAASVVLREVLLMAKTRTDKT